MGIGMLNAGAAIEHMDLRISPLAASHLKANSQ
jgi:hypothetical protein